MKREGFRKGRHYLGELMAVHSLLLRYSDTETSNQNKKVTNYKPELYCTNICYKIYYLVDQTFRLLITISFTPPNPH